MTVFRFIAPADGLSFPGASFGSMETGDIPDLPSATVPSLTSPTGGLSVQRSGTFVAGVVGPASVPMATDGVIYSLSIWHGVPGGVATDITYQVLRNGEVLGDPVTLAANGTFQTAVFNAPVGVVKGDAIELVFYAAAPVGTADAPKAVLAGLDIRSS